MSNNWIYNPDRSYVAEGVAISAGTYKGLDGHKVRYTSEFVTQHLANGLLYRPIVLMHTSRDKNDYPPEMQPWIGREVGAIINVGVENSTLGIKYIVNEHFIYEAIQNGELSLSMEADLDAIKLPDGTLEAVAGKIERVALEPVPACPDCVNVSAKEIHLAKPITVSLAQVENSEKLYKHIWVCQSMPNNDDAMKRLGDEIQSIKTTLAKLEETQVSPPVGTDVQKIVGEAIKTELKTALAPFYEEQARQLKEQHQAEINELKSTVQKLSPTMNLDTELAGLTNFEDQRNVLRGMQIALSQKRMTDGDDQGGDDSDGGEDPPVGREGETHVYLGGNGSTPNNDVEKIRAQEKMIIQGFGVQPIKTGDN